MKAFDDIDAAGLINPRFRDGTNRNKVVSFDLSAMSAFANVIPFDNNGLSGDSISYQELTLTTTGNIDNLDPVSGIERATLIRMNNATLATIRGLAAGFKGHRYVIQSVGAGQVDIAHDNAGSSTSNRIFTPGAITLSLGAGAGVAQLIYDTASTRWRVLDFDQGSWISYTPTWSATGTAPALGNGTLVGSYYRKGNLFFFNVQLTIGSTSTMGTGAWHFSLPGTVAGRNIGGTIILTDAGVTNYLANILIQTSTSAGGVVTPNGRLTGTAPFTFGTSDLCEMDGWFGFT